MFTDTEKEMNTIADNLSNFAKAIVKFINDVIAFFQSLGLGGDDEEAEG